MLIVELKVTVLSKETIGGMTELLHKTQPKILMESKSIPVKFVITRKQKVLQNLVMNIVSHKIFLLIVNIIGKNLLVNIQA